MHRSALPPPLRASSLLLAAAAAGLLQTAAYADYASEVLLENPLAFYRFAETVVAPDPDLAANLGSLGSVGAGRYTGTFTRPVAGALTGDSAVAFSNPTLGTGYFGAINIPNNAALNATTDADNSFTIEFWAKPTNNTAALLSPVSSMSFTTGRAGYLFYQNAGTWQFRVGNTGSTTANILDGGTVTANDWQHVTGVYTGVTGGTGGTMTLYVNGAEVSTSAGIGLYEPNTNAPFCIGSTSSPNRTFDGAVDEVAYYPTALAPSRILAHFMARTSDPAGYASVVAADAPVGYWRLNEPAPPVPVLPVAANAGSLGATANANYIGGATTAGTGPRPPQFLGFASDNKALSLSTGDGYVGTPLSLLNDRSAFTVMGWVKRGALHSARGGYFGQNDLLEFGDADAGTNIEAWIDAAGGNIISPYPGADDEWVYIVLTGTGQANELYLNGELAGTRNSAEPLGYGSNAFKFNIGGGGIFNTSGDYFLGQIDEVSVFDKAITTGRVKSLYHAALGNVPPAIVQEPGIQSPLPPLEIYATTTFTLSADASGTPPLSYLWSRNGTPIMGATSRTYTKTNAATGDSGDYSVVVTNAFGSAPSTIPVTVSVNPAVPPTITAPPAPRPTLAGGFFSFSVTVAGTAPFSYQWIRNGVDIPGATGATYSVAASASTTGDYSVRITNVVTSVTSAAATATLITPPAGSYEALVMSLEPVAYWRLDETSGTTAFDSAGLNDGTYTGGVTIGVAEAPKASAGLPGFPDTNRAAEFDGSTGYVLGPPGFLNNRTNFTLTGWVRRTTPAGHSTSFFGQNDKVEFGNSSDTQIGVWTGNSANGNNPLADEEWGFVVLTHQASPGVKTVYVNGNAIASTGYATQPNNSQAFCIGGGAWNNISALNDLFTGQIDEVAVFNDVLSNSEISGLYLLGRAISGQPQITRIPGGSGVAPLATSDFNTSDAGFTVDTPAPSSETEWVWAAGSWHSAGQSTAAGSDNVSYLDSPAFTITAPGVVSLAFNHRHSFEGDLWDGGNVAVSLNGGPFLTIGSLAFSQNGYNGTVRGDTSAHLNGLDSFIENSAGHPAFITSRCVLTGAQPGDTVKVRFIAAYDNNTTGPLSPSGWEIDSYELSQGGSSAAVVSWPSGIIQQSDNLSTSWIDVNAKTPMIIDPALAPKRFFRVKP